MGVTFFKSICLRNCHCLPTTPAAPARGQGSKRWGLRRPPHSLHRREPAAPSTVPPSSVTFAPRAPPCALFPLHVLFGLLEAAFCHLVGGNRGFRRASRLLCGVSRSVWGSSPALPRRRPQQADRQPHLAGGPCFCGWSSFAHLCIVPSMSYYKAVSLSLI